MMNVKSLVKVVASVATVLSLTGIGAETAQAASFNAPKLASAEKMPTDPAIKKGQKVMVVIKDTKKQTVVVYKKNGSRTAKSVKMGTKFVAKSVRRAAGKKLVQFKGNEWLNSKDLAQF